jgi:DNA-binding NarL/FixJ family response regulator
VPSKVVLTLFANARKPRLTQVGIEDGMLGSVLIVDDNRSVRQGVARLFKSQPDFEVCGEAHNGQRAVEMAESLHPDLIVMDISMPVMNGIEASRVLKRVMPKVPIIIFSDYSDALSEQDADSAGISARISKSGPLSMLLRKARTLLHRAKKLTQS